MGRFVFPAATIVALFGASAADAVPTYLNDQNMTVSLGDATAPVSRPASDPFNNVSTEQSLANVIDAPSADASELHNQSTHVWVTGVLELIFDFGEEYNLTTLHFWNYWGEGFDVDNIDFTFLDATMAIVGTLSVQPDLGGSGVSNPSDSTPLFAQDIELDAPLNVRFVSAVLTGSNTQVDFNNMGFTGEPSVVDPGPDPEPTPVPEPGTLGLFALGALGLGLRRRRAS